MTKKNGWGPTGFGERLRLLRTQSGLTQAKLAQKVECTIGTLSRLEQGVTEPAWPFALRLAAALGVEVTAFLPLPKPPRASKPRKPT